MDGEQASQCWRDGCSDAGGLRGLEVPSITLAHGPDAALLVPRLHAACRREPGARWRILPWAEAAASGVVDALVLRAETRECAPHTFRRLAAEAERAGVPLLLAGEALEVEEIPRRVRLGHTFGPDARDGLGSPFVPGLPEASPISPQRSFGFAAESGRDVVRLPPEGPTVRLCRLPRGVRLWTDDAVPRSIELVWTERGLRIALAGVGELDEPPVDWLTFPPQRVDAISVFADEIAGPAGAPRALLEPLVRLARVWIARALPPHVRRTARRFPPVTLEAIAARLLADSSGRVAQLADVCPAVLTLALFGPIDRVVERAVAGAPLPEVLALVRHICLSFDASRRPRAVPEAAWPMRQRFLRRAAASVPWWALASPHPPGLALDDVPLHPAANEAWFVAVALLADRMASDADAARLGPFVSAHGAELGDLPLPALARLFRRLTLRGRWLGRWPGRRTPVATALAQVQRWPDAEAARRRAERPLAPPPRSGLVVRELDSAEALALEGERMHHCAAQTWEDVRCGVSRVFAVEFRGERLTVELLCFRDGGLALGDVSAFANRAPGRAARAAVEAWVRAVSAGHLHGA